MEVTLLYVFILCPNAGQILVANIQSTLMQLLFSFNRGTRVEKTPMQTLGS